MKKINQYINEELTKVKPWIDVTYNLFLNAGKDLKKETINNMLGYLYDSERLLKFSNYLAEVDNSNYLAYQPSDDEFLNKDNKNKILEQISDYILKYMIK